MPTGERWLPAPGFEGRYEVSDHGRVRSLDMTVYCGQGRFRRQAGRILKQSTDDLGRKKVSLKGGAKENWRVHRLVALAFLPDGEASGLEVCHNDGDAGNNHVSNLRWDTRSENNYDLSRHGAHHQVKKSHCPRGHALRDPNLVPSVKKRGRRGNRECLACARAGSYVQYHTNLRPNFQQIADSYHAKILQREGREAA